MAGSRDFCARVAIAHPIIQAPLAAADTPELVAAVSNAGGLGMLGAAYLTPDDIVNTVAAIRRLTDQPFGVNLFAGGRELQAAGDPTRALDILQPFYDELDLASPELPEPVADPFEAQVEAVLALHVPVFSFTFGVPAPAILAELRRQGVAVFGTATTVTEATLLADAGVDAIVAQGSEAGAHRGTFAAPFEAAMIGTMALVPQVVDAVRVPVIASGGIMDGRGIVAARALGASAVQMGTAFLTCPESGIPAVYKAAIRRVQGEETALTRAFSGRPARGIVNAFLRAWQGNEEAILPFPLQNGATRPLRTAAALRGDARFLSLWCGQAGGLARDLPAGDFVRQLIREVGESPGTVGSPEWVVLDRPYSRGPTLLQGADPRKLRLNEGPFGNSTVLSFKNNRL